MGKIVTTFLSDYEARRLQGLCDENKGTQYSARAQPMVKDEGNPKEVLEESLARAGVLRNGLGEFVDHLYSARAYRVFSNYLNPIQHPFNSSFMLVLVVFVVMRRLNELRVLFHQVRARNIEEQTLDPKLQQVLSKMKNETPELFNITLEEQIRARKML